MQVIAGNRYDFYMMKENRKGTQRRHGKAGHNGNEPSRVVLGQPGRIGKEEDAGIHRRFYWRKSPLRP